MSPDELNLIFRSNFAHRGVTAADMSDALLSLERAPPKDESVDATIAMFRIAFPNRERWEKYTTKRALKPALTFLGLPSSGPKGQMVERISNAFETPPVERSIAGDADGADGGGISAGRSKEAGSPAG